MTDRSDQTPTQPPDPERRRFFRRFAGDVVTSVGSVIGAAQSLQAESAVAARELLAGEPIAAQGGPVEQDASTAGYRAPFRWDADEGVCRLIDQRRLPDVLVELELRGAGDAVTAINEGAVNGSPVQAQVAAVTLANVAHRARTSRPFARRATIRGAANAVRSTRPGSAAMAAVVARMLDRLERLDPDADGDEVAAAMRNEAEAVLFETSSHHGALVALGLEALPTEPEALAVLVSGSTGAMGGGQFGTALNVVTVAHHGGRPIQALVAESRPGFVGSRIAAWELGQAGVPHAIVTDAAAPGCVARGEVGAVLVGADRIAANGDVIAPAGTYALALAAAEARVPLLVFAATITIDPLTPTGDDAAIEEGRTGPVMRVAGTRIAPVGSRVRNPVQDRTPAALVAGLVTEEGVLRAPFAPAIAGAMERAAARRSAGS